jgi:molybdopterin-containing oxidoreductase family membrane subunit
VDWSIFLGTMSFFALLFLLFLRFVPSIAVAEVKELNHEMQHEAAHAGEHA